MSGTAPETKKTYTGLDVGKFIAALLVLTLHVHPLSANASGDFWLSCLCRIAVPFFFITSSYLFYKRGGDIRKYVLRILVLYAVWFVLEAPLTFHRFFIAPDKPFSYNLMIFVRGLAINSTFYASWFLTASWQGMLIVWWLSKRVNRTWLTIIGLVCFLSTLPGTMWYGLIAGTPIRPVYWLYNMALCPANSFIVAIPYCILGQYLADSKQVIQKKTQFLLLAVAVVFSIIEAAICQDSYWMSDTYLGLLFLSPCLVSLMAGMEVPIAPETSRCLRSMSTLIYLSHLPFRYILMSTLHLPEGGKLFLLTLAASVVFSWAVYLLSRPIRPLRYLY